MTRSAIRAAVLDSPGEPLRIDTLFLDAPGPGEVRVRTLASGLCHSDWHYISGDLSTGLPVVLGHEVSGVVAAVGPGVTRLAVGDHVVATITPSCGACHWCVSGRPTRCERVTSLRQRPSSRLVDHSGSDVAVLGGIGAFAEAVVLRESALAKLSHKVPPEVACLLGCCVSTGFGAVVHGAQVGPRDEVAIVGCGGVGVAAIQASRIAGARRIIAIDVHPDKLKLARTFGATDCVLAADENVRDEVLAICPRGVSHCFEAVGRPQTSDLAFSLLAPGGTATILGLMPDGSRISVDAAALVEGDRRVQGAYMGANRFLSDIDMLIDHYQSGSLDLDSMVTSVLDFDRINEGFERMKQPTTVRTVVVFPDDTEEQQ